ncbi:MAG: TetR/AcrR family transcriptional regulator [SAR324 cluster bacterium]|nr:TetR/AcrR family transcriptional regulator [SAR324 cluster bacterium]
MKTPDKIKAAARKIIAEKGLDGLSMRKLATVVGIKGPSIYKHFSGKEELLTILKSEAMAKLFDLAQSSVKGEDESEKRLLLMGEAYIQFSKSFKEEFKLLFFESSSLRESLDQEVPLSNPYGLLKAEFLALLKGSSDLEIETYSYGFWSLVHGMASLGISHLKNFKVENIKVESPSTHFAEANILVMKNYLKGLTGY